MKCRFCKYPADRILFEFNGWQVIADIHPASEGHVLVIPKKHYEALYEVPKEDLAEGMDLVSKCELLLIQEFKPKGIKIRNNYLPFIEENAHVVRHLHIHLVPLYGFEDFNEPFNRIEYTETIFKRLKKAFESLEKQGRL